MEPKRIKFATVSTSICHEVMRLDAMILVFCMLSFKSIFIKLSAKELILLNCGIREDS